MIINVIEGDLYTTSQISNKPLNFKQRLGSGRKGKASFAYEIPLGHGATLITKHEQSQPYLSGPSCDL